MGGADNPAGADDKDSVKYADIGATYYFNKNMSTYVDYKINLLDEDDSFYAANGISTDDIVALGLVYQFLKSSCPLLWRVFSVDLPIFPDTCYHLTITGLLP